jgi:hypothetical protein
MTTFSPRGIVSELGRHIVGRGDARRAAYTNTNVVAESLEA